MKTLRRVGAAARPVSGPLGSDARRIRMAYEQREAMVVDRPDFTLIRGQLPDFMRDQLQTK